MKQQCCNKFLLEKNLVLKVPGTVGGQASTMWNYDAGLQASTQSDPALDSLSAVSSVDITERAQQNPGDKHGSEFSWSLLKLESRGSDSDTNTACVSSHDGL